MKHFLVFYTLAATALIGVLGYQNREFKQRNAPPPLDLRTRFDIDTQGAPTLGPEDAPVEIVLFSDYQCTYCAQAPTILTELMAAHPDRIRVAYKHYPLAFHAQAERAATAAMAAHVQGKFWEMSRLLYEHRDALSETSYADFAGRLDLDPESFAREMASPHWHDYLTADKEAAEKAQVTGTPTYFVNGVKVRGNNLEHLKRAVAHALRTAR